MGIGEVLDAGFTLARRNFRSLATTTAWGAIPSYAAINIGGALVRSTHASMVALGVILTILGFVGVAILTAAVVLGCAQLIKPVEGDEQLNHGGLYVLAIFRFLPVLALGFIWIVAAIPLMIVLPLGIYVFVRWVVAYVIVVIEGTG